MAQDLLNLYRILPFQILQVSNTYKPPQVAIREDQFSVFQFPRIIFLAIEKDYQKLQPEYSPYKVLKIEELYGKKCTSHCSHWSSPKSEFCIFDEVFFNVFYHCLEIIGLVESYAAASTHTYLAKHSGLMRVQIQRNRMWDNESRVQGPLEDKPKLNHKWIYLQPDTQSYSVSTRAHYHVWNQIILYRSCLW